MMHLTGMVTGMRPPLPISQVPVPFMAAGIPGISWPVCPPVGKIPPQYEGDWIISPADESRLAQGLPLVPNEIRNDLSPGRNNAPGLAQFSDAAESSTGSGHVFGYAEAGALKAAHHPVPLAGLKQPTVNAQVSDKGNVDLSDFNPAVPPPQVNVIPAVAVSAQSVLVEPPGLQRRGKAHPDVPRGRGRLR
ncbi:hypothetical protein R5R35_004178 [Gryllus longicercus]|uniref:Uncharacterized protein n=1 Tax=Gryllus longicercus TaxID=2509291 RepID=A0AAN9YXL9_9ORTH